MQKNQLAPIALFVYNRPDHTKRTLESLRNNVDIGESELYVFCDGPNRDKDLDELRVEEVRNVVSEVSWCKKLTIEESPTNKGLRKSIIYGVSKILSEYDRVIVLEDDLEISPGFLQYQNDALRLYNDDETVMHISGYWFPLGSKNQRLPQTFFYQVPSCWGWGTWKRAWSNLEHDPKILLDKIKSSGLESKFQIGKNSGFIEQLIANVESRINTWAILWYATVFLNNGLSLHPRNSLINNIGHDGSGVNSRVNNSYNWNDLAENCDVTKIRLKLDPLAFKLMSNFYSPNPNLMKKIASKLWNLSPKQLYNWFKPNQNAKKIEPKPTWEVINGGPGHGLRLFVDKKAFIGWKEMLNGTYDTFLFDAVKSGSYDVIFDIGGHFGFNSLMFSRFFPEAEIHVFEPNPYNFELLKDHISTNDAKKVNAIEVAIGSSIGKINLNLSSNVQGSQSTGSYLEGVNPPLEESHYEKFRAHKVEVLTVDFYCSEIKTIPSLIKIDVEGAEAEVLKGGADILRKYHPDMLIEIHNVYAMYECMRILNEHGYQVEVIDKNMMSKSRCFIYCHF